MKVLLIEKCSDSMMWYKYCIGCYVPLLREENDCYWSKEIAGYSNIVRTEDASIVDVENPKFYTPVRNHAIL